jgi:hypothetical protein
MKGERGQATFRSVAVRLARSVQRLAAAKARVKTRSRPNSCRRRISSLLALARREDLSTAYPRTRAKPPVEPLNDSTSRFLYEGCESDDGRE